MHNSKRGERECKGENMNGLFDSSKLFDCQKMYILREIKSFDARSAKCQLIM